MKKNITLTRAMSLFFEHRKSLNYSPETIRSCRTSLNSLENFLRGKKKQEEVRLNEIARKEIDRYHEKRIDDSAPETVRSVMLRLSGFFRWAQRQSLILFSPMQGMRFKTVKRDISLKTISEKEVGKLLNSIDSERPVGLRDRAIIELMFSTGLRRREVVNLNLYDVDFQNETLRINQGKGKKDRIVPLGHRAKEWLKKYVRLARSGLLEGEADNALFVSQLRKRLSYRGFAKMIKVRMNFAGLKYSSHSLRHGFATALLRRGADIAVIQAMLGHSDIGSTEIYTEVVVEDMRKTLKMAHLGG